MPKIKILFIDSRGDFGGGSNHLLSILESLDPNKFDAFVAAPSGQGNSEKYRKLCRAFCDIPFRKFSLDAFRDLVEFAETHQVHFVHSHGRGAGIYSRFIFWKTKIPAIHTFHGISYGFFGAFIDRFLKKWTARFIHVSDSEREAAANLGVSDPRRAVTIYNGIDYRCFQSGKSRKDAKASLGLSLDHFVIGCVARFDACKRHQDLIEALALLTTRYPNLRLVLAGDGETRIKIEQLANECGVLGKVLFLGEQKNPQIVYAASDVFVLASEFEGLPLAPLEAMAAGCAVVLSNVRGNRDVVQDEKDGLLFEAKNPEALAAAIARLIGSQELQSRLIESAHRTVIERFSIDRMRAQIYAFYETLVPVPKFRKAALTHDWLFHMRGGEKVLESIGELFPLAPIYTLFLDQKKLSESINRHQIIASWLNQIPLIAGFYRYLLPLFPLVMKQFDIKDHLLIVSSNHCAAKSISKGRRALHICYCHAPMRYAWGFESEYFGRFPFFLRSLIRTVLSWLRYRDLGSNPGVDHFIANSQNIRKRINQYYAREADVIYPPIQKRLKQCEPAQSSEYLIVSALVPYKRIDIAVQAFNELQLPLTIIGSGPLLPSLQKQAKSNIRFLGWQPDHEVAKYYASCKALIFPTEEDFGMVPVEAMMYGKPVIAFACGGALETVIPGKTGLLFDAQTPEALTNAVKQFSINQFDSKAITAYAQKFSAEHFNDAVIKLLSEFTNGQAN